MQSLLRHKVQWTDQAENLCQIYVNFLYIFVGFLYINRLHSFGKTWQLENLQKPIANYVPTVCMGFLRSNFTFSNKQSKVFHFKGPPDTHVGWSCMLSFPLGRTIIWLTIWSFTVLFTQHEILNLRIRNDSVIIV